MFPPLYDHRKLEIGLGHRFAATLNTGCSGRCTLQITSNQGIYGQVKRPISTGQLNALLRLHLQPINVVIYHGSSGRTHLVVGFSLICFQRLSFPDLATQRCPWQDNWYTRGRCFPVLSY